MEKPDLSLSAITLRMICVTCPSSPRLKRSCVTCRQVETSHTERQILQCQNDVKGGRGDVRAYYERMSWTISDTEITLHDSRLRSSLAGNSL